MDCTVHGEIYIQSCCLSLLSIYIYEETYEHNKVVYISRQNTELSCEELLQCPRKLQYYSRANLAKWFHIKTQAAHSTQSEFWVMTTVLCIARCASIFSVDHFCVDLPHWNLAVFLTFCHWRWVTKLNLYYYNLYIYLIKLLYISQSG